MDSRLNEPTLSASDVRDIAGLTYRQQGEWARRDALPHERNGKTGWRRMNFWQAVAVSIAADLQRRFGLPVGRLAQLTSWMLGGAPTLGQYFRLLRAEDLLCAFDDAEKARQREQISHRIRAGTLKVIEATPLDFYTVPAPKSPQGPSADAHVKAGVAITVPRLVKRGWTPDSAAEFAQTFYTLSVAQRFGTEGIAEITALKAFADAAADKQASRALTVLAGGLLPLFDAFAFMSSGFRVLLLTDFEQSVLLDEIDYTDRVRAGDLPLPLLVLDVSDHLNRAFEARGMKPMPVTVRATDIEPADPKPTSESEREILTLLRERDFDRLVVEPRSGGYRIELEQDLSGADACEIESILAQHDYQTVTLKKHDGRVVRISQAVSMKIPPAADGRSPTRREKQR